MLAIIETSVGSPISYLRHAAWHGGLVVGYLSNVSVSLSTALKPHLKFLSLLDFPAGKVRGRSDNTAEGTGREEVQSIHPEIYVCAKEGVLQAASVAALCECSASGIGVDRLAAALRLNSGLHGLRTIDARTGPFPEIQYAVNQSAVEIPSGSISGARLASIAPRLSLWICGPVQAGRRTETGIR